MRLVMLCLWDVVVKEKRLEEERQRQLDQEQEQVKQDERRMQLEKKEADEERRHVQLLEKEADTEPGRGKGKKRSTSVVFQLPEEHDDEKASSAKSRTEKGPKSPKKNKRPIKQQSKKTDAVVNDTAVKKASRTEPDQSKVRVSTKQPIFLPYYFVNNLIFCDVTDQVKTVKREHEKVQSRKREKMQPSKREKEQQPPNHKEDQPSKQEKEKSSKREKVKSAKPQSAVSKPAFSMSSGRKRDGLNPKTAGKHRKPGDSRARKVSAKTSKPNKPKKPITFDVFGDDCDFSFG
jgi:hypothetical protein